MSEGRPSLELRAGIILVAALFAIAILAPILAPYDPNEQLDPVAATYRPPGSRLAAVHLRSGQWELADRVVRTAAGIQVKRLGKESLLPASEVLNLTSEGVADRRVFWLGTDGFGRDLLSRMVWGARISLGIAAGVVAIALTLAILIGSAAALGGPIIDMVLMRLVDALVAFPPLFMLIALSAFLHPGTGPLLLILASFSWMYPSRVVRAQILSLRERDFVLAARGLGFSPRRVLLRHLLPNALGPVIVQTSLMPATLIVQEATLSFLGLGLQPPTASWGNLIADGQPLLTEAWWLALFPGIALALTVVAFNFLGEGLRDRLDPTTEASSRTPAPGVSA
jgi:peptide/nickel transport system permease protein